MKQSVGKLNTKIAATGLTLFVLSSCGGYDSQSMPASQGPSAVMEETSTFTAHLSAVNTRTVPNAMGDARIVRNGENFIATINMNGVSDTEHTQTIMSGRCPEMADDADGDGKISGTEAASVLGTKVLDLDDDLMAESLLDDGDNTAPTDSTMGTNRTSAEDDSADVTSTTTMSSTTGEGGRYHYQQSGSWDDIASVLGEAQDDDGRGPIIVIFGNDDDDSLPIACGQVEERAQNDSDNQGDDQDQGQQDQHQQQQQQQQQMQQRQHQQQQQHQQSQMNNHMQIETDEGQNADGSPIEDNTGRSDMDDDSDMDPDSTDTTTTLGTGAV